jgi:hypothetical protein
MQQILSLMVAAATFAAPASGTSAIATSSPIAVSTCAVTDLYNSASLVDFGSPITYRSLQLTFRNTEDTDATQVAFDVTHGGEHTTVIDRGRFSKGVPIEHVFVNEISDGGYSRIPDACTVASITFADGHRWSASRSAQ